MLEPGATYHTHRGGLAHDDLIGRPEGSLVTSAVGTSYLALRPLLTGKRTVKVNAHFESRNGTLTLALKDVTGPDGKPFAGKVITDLLQSIGTRQPEAYDPATPFPLPFGLKRVWTEKQSLLGET